MEKRFGVLPVIILVLCGIALGCVISYSLIDRNPSPVSLSAADGDFAKLKEIRAYLDYYFVGDLDDQQLLDYAAEGLIAGTGDRWSYYISADEMDSYQEQMNNAYVGIGITIQNNETQDGYSIISITAGSSAEAAGLRPGDELIAVEGENAWELGMTETRNRVRGETGTFVTITIRRGRTLTDYTLERKSVALETVTWKLLRDNAALICIKNFDANICKDTIAAIEEALDAGAKSLIFDVRNNPGGYQHELVQLLDYLLPEGPLFRSSSYDGKVNVEYSDSSCLSMPMAVLVNENSYSAAEFFAVALQEYEWAAVIGTGTSGKGYFQNTFYLSDGSAIAISTGEYRTPLDHSLVGVGIVPDIYLNLDDEDYYNQYYGLLAWEDDEQILAALEAVKE